MTPRRWWTLLLLLVVFTAARVMTTHRVFNQTSDEPHHIASGYEVMKRGTYKLDPEHPPLARVLFALPFLNTPDPGLNDPREQGNALLNRNDRYTQNLGRARPANLLFLALGIITVALWARHLFSPGIGLVAALLYASIPVVLAHSGFATTDMAGAALFTLAAYVTTLFLEQPTWKRTLLLGAIVAAGALAKFSFVLFFPAAALMLAIARRRLPLRTLAAIALAFALVWGAYGFSVGTLQGVDEKAVKMSTDVFGSPRFATMHWPAPIWVNGLLVVKNHDHFGHPAFLFGEKRWEGWWYYFPVALFYKTPIPFLLLAIAGCILLVRRKPEVVLIAAAVLGIAMTSHLNIGVRHVLPIYAPLAIAAAYAVVSLRRFRDVSIALIAWMLISVAAAHPDYVPWFNFAAGRHPERILNDSNLDWGQDVLRLLRAKRNLPMPSITVSLFTTTDLDRLWGLKPYTILQANTEVHGWLAISEMHIALGRAYSPEVKVWLDELLDGRPYRRIGKSIRLYNLTSRSLAPAPATAPASRP